MSKSLLPTYNDGALKYCFIIPVYRHGSTLMKVVDSIQKYFLPIIIVDDGNDDANKAYIKNVIDKYNNTCVKNNFSAPLKDDGCDSGSPSSPNPCCTLITLDRNSGKGAAMKAGILRAHEMGFTHIFQLDSDGQHDLNRVDAFLRESYNNPAAVICGYGAYDKSAPRHRVNGRKVANAWVHIVTLSRKIKDSMIGFRVYPVEPSYRVETHSVIDSRMGFDIDLLVHLAWLGVPIINKQVKIYYPLDGVSNFRNVRDNMRIGAVYTKLCVTMLLKWPVFLTRILRRKAKNNRNIQLLPSFAS